MDIVVSFLWEGLIVGFLIKKVLITAILAHWTADKLKSYSKRWLDKHPDRVGYYNSLVTLHRSKAQRI